MAHALVLQTAKLAQTELKSKECLFSLCKAIRWPLRTLFWSLHLIRRIVLSFKLCFWVNIFNSWLERVKREACRMMLLYLQLSPPHCFLPLDPRPSGKNPKSRVWRDRDLTASSLAPVYILSASLCLGSAAADLSVCTRLLWAGPTVISTPYCQDPWARTNRVSRYRIAADRCPPKPRNPPGCPSAPAVEITDTCLHWRDTSAFATGGTASVPNANWSRRDRESWRPR